MLFFQRFCCTSNIVLGSRFSIKLHSSDSNFFELLEAFGKAVYGLLLISGAALAISALVTCGGTRAYTFGCSITGTLITGVGLF